MSRTEVLPDGTRITHFTAEESRNHPRWGAYFRAAEAATPDQWIDYEEYRRKRNARIAETERAIATWLDDGGARR